MSGQSAHLSLKEAKAIQERVQCGSNHSSTHGGSHSTKKHKESEHKEPEMHEEHKETA